MFIDFYNRGNGGGGTGTSYNSITETADSTRIANQYIDLEGALSINGESFEENVIANEADPVWNREKNNYYTKDESDAKFATAEEFDIYYTKEEANENSIDSLDERVTALEEGGGGTGTSYNSITETADSTRIANQYIDLEGALSINGESFEENVIANEADPVWNREKNNYYTKDESDAKFATAEEFDIYYTKEEANENSIDSLDERVTALEEGGGGGIPQALHYESEEIDDGEGNTYREILDINKDESIYFHRSDDEDGVHSAYIFRDGMQYNDADDEEGTNMRACNVGPYGIDILYDDGEMPATHISYGSVIAEQGNVQMMMDVNSGMIGAVTMSEEGEPTKGVMMIPDGIFQVFDAEDEDNQKAVAIYDGHISINGYEQPIMQVLTKEEYDDLEDKKDYILYIIKG